MKRRGFRYSAIMMFAMFACGTAETADSGRSTVTLHGFVGFENAQIVKGVRTSNVENVECDRGWLERALIQVSHEFAASERLKLNLAIESQYAFSYPQSMSDRTTMLTRYWLYPARVDALYSLGDPTNPWLQFQFGYFPYKYNRLVTNLGEFLFRTGTYPPYIVNSFNMPFARLLGLRIGSTLLETFKQDLMITSEAQIFPVQDFSLSYLGRFGFGAVFEAGAGVTWAHAISVEHRLTSPDRFPDPKDPDRFAEEDKYFIMYLTEKGDTGYYSFEGVKPMAMLSFDPKPLLPEDVRRLLGRDDGCLYGEGCVIGWTNYRNYNPDTVRNKYPDYRNRADRTPFMVGFNIPAFKIMDVLSLEFEHFTDTYPNSYWRVMNQNLPAYFLDPTKRIAQWRWSLYAKRTFFDRIVIVGQVARDHMRPSYPSYILAERADVLPRPGDWWWVLRVTVKY